MKTTLDITERTIGYLLTHTQNDAPCHHKEITPFLLNGKKDMSFMDSIHLSESDLIDFGSGSLADYRKKEKIQIKKLCDNNPFLGVSLYSALINIYEPTAFSVLERAIVREHYYLRQAVVDCITDPWNTGKQRNYLLEEMKQEMGSGYTKHYSHNLFFLCELSKKLDIENNFLLELQEYIAAYERLYTAEKYIHEKIDPKREHTEFIARQKVSTELIAHKDIINKIYPSERLKQNEEELGIFRDFSLLPADNHVLAVLSSVTSEQLLGYAQKYYKGGSSNIAESIAAILTGFNSINK